jgi:hypothetical protein
MPVYIMKIVLSEMLFIVNVKYFDSLAGMTVGQCCFEVDSAEHWYQGSSDFDGAVI